MTDEQPDRRVDDRRLAAVETKVDGVANDVRSIRDMLISEPEASPLGRSLLKASQTNRGLIEELREDFEKAIAERDGRLEKFIEERHRPIERWWHESAGAWKVFTGAGVILGALGAFFGIAAWFVQPR